MENTLNSQEIEDDLVSVEVKDKTSEKILIIYEIHNNYLDEIQRYKDKKDILKPLSNFKEVKYDLYIYK